MDDLELYFTEVSYLGYLRGELCKEVGYVKLQKGEKVAAVIRI